MMDKLFENGIFVYLFATLMHILKAKYFHKTQRNSIIFEKERDKKNNKEHTAFNEK